jgi:hypothetical protein
MYVFQTWLGDICIKFCMYNHIIEFKQILFSSTPLMQAPSAVPPLTKKRNIEENHPCGDKKVRCRIPSKFPCRTRSGMSVSMDSGYQKRGFDSLTGKML